jgi:glycosyltransferase involved in cell wall biosynthesis
MSNGLVSIVIPSFNRPEWLAQAVQSASIQSYPNIEILIVDDASTHEMESLSMRLQSIDSRIRWIQLPTNQGLRNARQVGALQAQGEFIQFLDDDDALHPEKLRLQVDMLAADPELGAVSGQTVFFRDQPGDRDEVWNTFAGSEDILFRFISHNHLWGPHGPLYRRDALIQANGYGNPDCMPAGGGRRRYEDYEHSTWVLIHGLKAKIHPHPVSMYRSHRQQRVSVISALDRVRDLAKVMENLAGALKTMPEQPIEYGDAMRQNFLWVSMRALEHGDKTLSLRAINLAKEWSSDKHAKVLDILLDAVFSGRVDAPTYIDNASDLGVNLSEREGWWAKYRLQDERLEPIPQAGRYRRSRASG